MPQRPAVSLDPDGQVVHGEPKQAGLTWPLAVEEWLQRRIAEAHGSRPTKAEAAAALMTALERTPAELDALVMAYRKRTVGDLLRWQPGDPWPEYEFAARGRPRR